MSQEVDKIIEEARRQRMTRIWVMATGILVGLAVGIFLTTITVKQAREILALEDSLSVKSKKLSQLQHDIDTLTVVYNNLIKDIDQLRMSDRFVKEALDSLARKNYQAAIEIYDRALLLNPTNVVAITNKGFAQLVSGNEKDALKTLLVALQVDGSYAWTHYHLALAYFSSSQPSLGLLEMKKAIQLDPGFKYRFKKDYLFKDIIRKPEVAQLLQ